MKRTRLLWQLIPSYLLITVIAVLAITWYASDSLHRFYRLRVEDELKVRCGLIEDLVREAMAAGAPDAVDRLCKDMGQRTGSRFTVVLPSGEVIGDSERLPREMANHADRPEIVAALARGAGVAVRFSETLRENMAYVALPLAKDGQAAAVVRCALPLTTIEHHVRDVHLRILLGGLAVALLASLISLVVARQISQPLEEMKRGAERFARGELAVHLPVPDSEEMASLATTLNEMADQLDNRIDNLTRERREREALFAAMEEAVIAVDMDERVLEMNPAAARLSAMTAEEARGRTIQEVIRNSDLQRFVAQALAGEEPVEGDVVFHGETDRFMQARGSTLRGQSGLKVGALVVLTDVTRLKRLENLRRDFVANASHELKTPVTSIKGAIETLQERAAELPAELRPFLEMAGRHSDRLCALVEDLLSLSRIEHAVEGRGVAFETAPVRPVLEAAMRACETKAAEKRIALRLECPESLTARFNPLLLEQAVVNLLTNAIQYSEAASEVTVRGGPAGGSVALQVVDRGCGIEAKHLPRLFERFYRVDTARSRKMGGTGLGLAIVKHVALAHEGSVSVESAVGKGSTFTIRLPAG